MFRDEIKSTIEAFSYMSNDEIVKKYKDHVYLKKKDKGVAKALRGKVDLIVYFISDQNSKWTQFFVDEAMKRYNSAARILNAAAACRGVDLRLKCVFLQCTLPMVCERTNHNKWEKAVAGLYGKKNMWEYQEDYKREHNCDEVPIMFSFAKQFRAYATTTTKKGMEDEFSTIAYKAKERTIIHELLHQFGAVDFYYPSYVKTLLMALNYKSVMASDEWWYIDSLTTYLIGWTDGITKKAAKILEETKHFTWEAFQNELSKEWKKTDK